MAGPGVAGLRAWTGRSPQTVDRVLLGLCVLVWLLLLGMSVAAVVALVDLGQGFHKPADNQHTGVLYIVIGVSALIILAAIPMLLRARQTGQPGRPSGVPVRSGAPAGLDARRAERSPVIAAQAGPRHAAVARIVLRGTAELASAIGVALIAVAAATYLMAVGKDTAAWSGYGVAGFVTVLMPMIPWWNLRQLKTLTP